MTDYDVAIIGGGPAGMAAALGAVSENAGRVLLCERESMLGGILNQCLHTGFGAVMFGRELTGPEFAREFIRRIEASGVEVRTGTSVTGLDDTGQLTLSGASGYETVTAKTVILASGCRERPAGALDIAGTRPSGVFTAGAAQRMINLGGYDIGERVVILGSGDVGLIVAGALAERGASVIAVLEKEDRCGGLARNRIRCLERNGIPLTTRCTVTEIHGTERVTGITTRMLDSGEERAIPCDTLITSVGLIPERELIEGLITSGRLPDWLFLCGNACFVHDLVDDVAAEAERTGRGAMRFACGLSGPPDAENGQINRTEAAGGDVCVACPKGCAVVRTPDGWAGMACGRSAPEL